MFPLVKNGSLSRWYNEPPLKLLDDETRLTVATKENYVSFPTDDSVKVVMSDNRNLGVLFYPNTKKAVVFYAKRGLVEFKDVQLRGKLSRAEFNVNRVYLHAGKSTVMVNCV